MSISLRGFLVCFVALCVAFVPVLFNAGLYLSIEPVSAFILHIFTHRLDRISWWLGLHVGVYTCVFSAIGALACVLLLFLPWRPIRLLLLAMLFALPVISSFARVLTYSSIQGSGGTYTFWGAAHRYFENRH